MNDKIKQPVGRVLRDLELKPRRVPVSQESAGRSLISWLFDRAKSTISLDDVSGAWSEEILRYCETLAVHVHPLEF